MISVPVRRTKPKLARQLYTLTEEERDAFLSLSRRQLHADGKPVWDFWRAVADARGLDYESIIGNPNDWTKFTAFPLGHGKHWCWPSALNVKPPANFDNVAFA